MKISKGFIRLFLGLFFLNVLFNLIAFQEGSYFAWMTYVSGFLVLVLIWLIVRKFF